jgi:hypothetical protein
MSNTIAERFLTYTEENNAGMLHWEEVYNFLKQQPENQKTFTIEEMKQMARYAFIAHQYTYVTVEGFEMWWAEKKKELLGEK